MIPPSRNHQLAEKTSKMSTAGGINYQADYLDLNPITYGGFLAPDHQIIDGNSKTAQHGTSKPGHLLGTFWHSFRKIDSPGGLL